MNMIKHSMPSKLKQCMFITLATFFFILLFSPYHIFVIDNLTADDASYLSHGFTLGLNFNLEYTNSIHDWINPKTGAPVHPIGAGLLAAPFIALFSVLDRVMDAPVLNNPYLFSSSWSYFGFVFASGIYFLAGIFLYISALKSFSKVSYWEHLLLACGFGVIYYVTYRPIMGHAYEFFALALVTFGSCKILENKNDFYKKLFVSFCVAAGIVLTLLIRPANIQVFLLPVIIFLTYYIVNAGTFQDSLEQIKSSGCWVVFWFILLAIPLITYHITMFGEIYPTFKTMYGDSSNNYLKNIEHSGSISLIATVFLLLVRLPYILNILFSSEFGILYTSPILTFGIIFLICHLAQYFSTKTKVLLCNYLLISAYVGLPLSLVILWQSCADAYGYRFLFSLYPLAILGYVLWRSQKQTILKKTLYLLIIGLSFFAILSPMFYGLNDNLKYQDNVTLEGDNKSGAQGYTIAVLESSLHPSFWLTLAAYRMPGFMMTKFLGSLPDSLQSNPIVQKGKAKIQSRIPPTQVYIQVSIIFLMFLISFLLIGLLEYRKVYHANIQVAK